MNRQESGFRWVVFGTVLFAYFLTSSQRTAPGLITDQLMIEFYVSAAVIGLASSIQFFAYSGLQIPSGLLADRFGPNRFLIAGTFLAGCGSILYSLAPNEYWLIFGRLLAGVGDAAIYINLVLILTQWFVAGEFVRLLGVATIVGSLGALFATVPFSMWIAYAGWRMPFFSTGAILVVLSFLLYVVLIWRPKKMFQEDSARTVNLIKKRDSVWNILQRIFSTRQAWALFLCHFGIVGTYTGFIGSWGVPFGIQVLELSRLEASRFIMYGLMGATIGAPIIGWIVKKLGSIKKVYVFVHLLVLSCWLGLFLTGTTPSYPLAVGCIVILGAGLGSSALTFALVRESFPVHEVGVASGFANTGGFISAILLPFMYGKVLDLFSQETIVYGYHYGFIIAIGFAFLGFLGAVLIKQAVKEGTPSTESEAS